MKKILVGVLFTSLACTNAMAQKCYDDKITAVIGSGHYIELSSGQIFQVFPGQSTTVIFWQPLNRVKVCYLAGNAVKITNIAQKNTSIQALRK